MSSSILRNACVKDKQIPYLNNKAVIIKPKGIFVNKKCRDTFLEIAENGDVEYVLTVLNAMELIFKVKKISIYERYLQVNGEDRVFHYETCDLNVERGNFNHGQIVKIKENELVGIDDTADIVLVQVTENGEQLQKFVKHRKDTIIFLETIDIEEVKEVQAYPIEQLKEDIYSELIRQTLGDDIFTRVNKQDILAEVFNRRKWKLKKLKFYLLDLYGRNAEEVVDKTEGQVKNRSKNLLSCILERIPKYIEKILD